MISELKKDLQCEHILDCMYGLKKLDKKCYEIIILSEEPITASEIADNVNRDSSTVSRSLKRLINSGLIYKEKRVSNKSGYEYVYYEEDIEKVTESMEELVSEWETKINTLISEFNVKYSN